MITADSSTVLDKAPKIQRIRIPANKEQTVQAGEIVSRYVEAENSRRRAQSARLHVCPKLRLLQPRRCVEATAKIFELLAAFFIHCGQEIVRKGVRSAVVQLDILVAPR